MFTVLLLSDKHIAQVENVKMTIIGNLIDSQTILQEIQSEQLTKDVHDGPGTAFYLELLGKPFYTVNVDFRINKSNRYSFGIQSVYGGIIPNAMYYYLGGRNNRFEVGAGLSVIIAIRKAEDDDSKDIRGVLLHGVIGYRYQKKNGLIFRIGFTPLFFSEGFLPMIGISFGYSL